MPNKDHTLPLFDAKGQPLTLKPTITYTMRVKNGYILGLKEGQHQTQLPNLLESPRRRRQRR